VPVWLLILFLCLAGLTSPLSAQWYKDYERAQDALEKQEWSRAIELVEKLTQRTKKPDANRRAEGNFRSPYYPYFLLGKAYYGLQDLDSARANLKESLGYGLLKENQEAEVQRLLEHITNWELAGEALARGENQHLAKGFREALSEFDSADRHLQQAGDLSDSAVATRVHELRTEASRALRDWESRLDTYRKLRDQVQSALSDERFDAAESGLVQAAAALDEADQIYPQQSEAERSRQELAQLTSDLQDRMALPSPATTSKSASDRPSTEVEKSGIDPATDRVYVQALASAEEAYRSNLLQDAIAGLEKARQANSERFQGDGQNQRIESVSRQLERLNQTRRNSITAYRAGNFQTAIRGFEELVSYPDISDARSWRDRARAGQVKPTLCTRPVFSGKTASC
jgi:tetratricopeptide (TPR) repeat protein